MLNFLERWRIISFIFLILIAVEIFYISSLSFGPGGGGIALIPLTYHFTVFFLFNTFLLATIKGQKKMKAKHLIIALLISFAYSILDEIHQSFIPGRVAGIKDVIVNNTGILLSTLVYLYKEKFNKQPQQNLLFSGEEYESGHASQTDRQHQNYY